MNSSPSSLEGLDADDGLAYYSPIAQVRHRHVKASKGPLPAPGRATTPSLPRPRRTQIQQSFHPLYLPHARRTQNHQSFFGDEVEIVG